MHFYTGALPNPLFEESKPSWQSRIFILLQLNNSLIFFSVGARVWACEWKAEFSGSDSYRHGAEEADWEFIFWSQHAGASQPRCHAARHSRSSRSAQVLFLSPDWKVKFVLRSKKKSFWVVVVVFWLVEKTESLLGTAEDKETTEQDNKKLTEQEVSPFILPPSITSIRLPFIFLSISSRFITL